MKMNSMQRILTAAIIICGVSAIGEAAVVKAKAHHHHDGGKLVAAKLKTDGHHDLEKRGHYTSSVETKGGKIAAFHVNHDTKGNIPVTKYKSHKKMAQASGAHLVNAAFALPQDTDMGTVYIGYSYVDDDGNEEVYWFPYDEILDGDTGAIEYVAES